MNNQQIGKIGESIAFDYLIAQNYDITATNYYTRHGEIDLIAIDQSTGELVFIEEKTRTGNTFGPPQDAVDFRKKQKILKTLLHFLNTSNQKLSRTWRVDVIALELTPQYRLKNINHFKNIFDG